MTSFYGMTQKLKWVHESVLIAERFSKSFAYTSWRSKMSSKHNEQGRSEVENAGFKEGSAHDKRVRLVAGDLRLGLLLLDVFDASEQLWKAGKCCILFLVFFDRARRSSPNRLALPNRLSSRNPSLRADNSPILDSAMVSKANLSGHERMLANGDVVSYLHKVVNFDSRGDSRTA